MKTKKSTEVVNLRVRFPKGVLNSVKAAAKRNQRSQNAEIVFRVARSLESADAALVTSQ